MTRLVVVKRIPVSTSGFDYRTAKAEVDAALTRGDDVAAVGDAIVIRRAA